MVRGRGWFSGFGSWNATSSYYLALDTADFSVVPEPSVAVMRRRPVSVGSLLPLFVRQPAVHAQPEE